MKVICLKCGDVQEQNYPIEGLEKCKNCKAGHKCLISVEYAIKSYNSRSSKHTFSELITKDKRKEKLKKVIKENDKDKRLKKILELYLNDEIVIFWEKGIKTLIESCEDKGLMTDEMKKKLILKKL